MDCRGKTNMNTYQLDPSTTTRQADALTLTLRKYGYSAWFDSDGLHTNATRPEITLIWGTSTIIAR